MPFIRRKRANKLITLVLIGILWAYESGRKKQKGRTEYKKGSKKPEYKEEKEDIPLIFTLSAYFLEKYKKFVFVSWYILHNFNKIT